jgi:hypothetical protein
LSFGPSLLELLKQTIATTFFFLKLEIERRERRLLIGLLQCVMERPQLENELKITSYTL